MGFDPLWSPPGPVQFAYLRHDGTWNGAGGSDATPFGSPSDCLVSVVVVHIYAFSFVRFTVGAVVFGQWKAAAKASSPASVIS